MSNRRRLASERGARIRCPRCRCTDYATKRWADDSGAHVCNRCQHDWPAQPDTERGGRP